MGRLVVSGIVVTGHGVASGRAGPFAGGSIRAQRPHFAAAGLLLDEFHPGTINLSIAPAALVLTRPTHTIRDVTWWDGVPPETFSFVPCTLVGPDGPVAALIYRPHPETKPAHFQPSGVVEILAPWTPGIRPGMRLTLEADSDRVALIPPSRVQEPPGPG